MQDQIFRWVTGVGMTGDDAPVVVAPKQWVPELRTSGLLDDHGLLMYTAAAAGNGQDLRPASLPAGAIEVDGDFADPGGDLLFADGTRMAQSRYGLAELNWLDVPTILRITDDDDFSAFLRDADTAFATGQFAAHLTDPAAVIADLAALGGRASPASPRHRLFVDWDGVVSTSPTGSPLGTASDSMADVEVRWRERNASSSRPCAVCLARAVNERDRTEALAERPWMDLYVDSLRALHAVSVAHPSTADRSADRVVGFGSFQTQRAPSADPQPPGMSVLVRRNGLDYQVDTTTLAVTVGPSTANEVPE